MEQPKKLEYTTRGQFKNITLKPKKDSTSYLKDGEFIVVQKVYATGYRNEGSFGASYSCKVRLPEGNGELTEVSFWLTEKEHERFAQCGGEDDWVKITLHQEIGFNKKGTQTVFNNLDFESVNVG